MPTCKFCGLKFNDEYELEDHEDLYHNTEDTAFGEDDF